MAPLALARLLDTLDAERRGELPGDTVFARVEVDASAVRPGDLFVAVPDERLDGHELTPVAALRGATAALVSRAWAARVRELALPLLVVDDPVAALQRLAAARRAQLEAVVVGITGSVGKTSTKEAVAAALARSLRTHRSSGNRNNELGVPLSLLDAPDDAEALVLELGGAYAPGEIALLASVARPRVGVVTNVGPVHLERMGSLDAIARTKAELVEALPRDGVAVLNGDDPRVSAMAASSAARVLTYGRGDSVDVQATEVRLRGLDGCSFRLRVGGREPVPVDLPLLGPHAVETALAALAVGQALGLDAVELLPGLCEPGLQVRLRPRPGIAGSLLLDDAYNSSPASAESALALLAACAPRRRIAVLGDMLELGPLAETAHRELGRDAARVADVVVAVGDHAALVVEGAERQRGDAVTTARFARGDRDALVGFLRSLIAPDDVVLVKGSRALGLEGVVETLAAEPEPRLP